jgi:type II secretory pathway component PulJ
VSDGVTVSDILGFDPERDEEPRRPSLEGAHKLAMDAKATIFRAQDACSLAWEHDPQQRVALRKVEKRLAKVRAELEALDRDVQAARWRVRR